MKRALLALLWVGLATARADDPDLAALELADSAPKATGAARDWQLFGELATAETAPRQSGAHQRTQRFSLDLAVDSVLAPGWRGILADRVDVAWNAPPTEQRTINTLKEAYLNWQPRDDALLDLGRINARNGVATGYNPTDYFRRNAIRSLVSIEPQSLKNNRLGSVMLRGQKLWGDGALSASYSPRLTTQRHGDAFNPDVGATNDAERWLLSVSQKLTADLQPQLMLFGEQAQPLQLGYNLTHLLTPAAVGFIEGSLGRSRSLLAQAVGSDEAVQFRHRLATGVSYTTAQKLTVTLEYDYNGGALNKTDWDALRRGSPLVYGAYRQWLQATLEPATRDAFFLYATWQDALVNHLDLSAMARANCADRSRLAWLEARYHWSHTDLAVQWQVNGGDAGSEFGVLPRRAWQVALRQFF